MNSGIRRVAENSKGKETSLRIFGAKLLDLRDWRLIILPRRNIQFCVDHSTIGYRTAEEFWNPASS